MPANFRRRCELALTHPVTMGALVVLLVNDWVLKPLWQSDWTTGKLSDLAWVVFASPLLAFLLSRLTREHRLAERCVFSVAYVGLPLLYAAFNTFERLHDLILSVLLFVGGGSVGSPFDPTDSLVIPFGIAVAGWAWHRSGTDDGGLRARCCLLVAVVASIASIASSCHTPGPQAWHVGVRGDGAAFMADHYGGYSNYSYDGGLTWLTRPRDEMSPAERDQSFELGTAEVATPRGTYAILGSSIVRRMAGEGELEVYNTGYLLRGSNMWAQGYRTREIRGELTSCDDEERLLTTAPLNITYHPGTGNVIVAMGLEGVLVGSPNEEWRRVAVGGLVPTNFSLAGKARMAFSTYFWLTALALCLCLVTAGLVLSPREMVKERTVKRPDMTRRSRILRSAVPLAIILVGILLVPVVGFGNNPVPLLVLLGVLAVAALVLWQIELRNMEPRTVMALLIAAGFLLALVNLNLGILPIGLLIIVLLGWLVLPSKMRASISAVLGMVLSCLGFPPFGPVFFQGSDISPAVGIAGLVFAVMGLLSYTPPREGWRACFVAVLAMIAAIVVPFSVWLQGSIPVVLAAVFSGALLVFTAYRLHRFLTERMPFVGPPLPDHSS